MLNKGRVDICFVTFIEPVHAHEFRREFFHAKLRKKLMKRIKEHYDAVYTRQITNASFSLSPSTPDLKEDPIVRTASVDIEDDTNDQNNDEIIQLENVESQDGSEKDSNSAKSPSQQVDSAAFQQREEDVKFEQALESIELIKKIHVTKWRVKMAIDRPDAVLWKNIYSSTAQRWTVNFFTTVLVLLISLFWTLPIAIFANITVIATSDDTAPYFGWILSLPQFFIDVIQTVIPVVLTSVFYMCLPELLKAIAMLERPHSTSSLNRSVFHKYFIFSLTNLIIFKVIADTTSDILRFFSNDLASATLEGFFLLFSNIDFSRVTATMVGTLIRKTLFDTMIELSLLTILLLFLVKNVKQKLTRVTDENSFQPREFHYAIQFGYILMALSLGLTFCLISPITIVGGLFYVLFKSLVAQHNLLFVHPRNTQISGKLFSAVINNAFVILILFQLTMFVFLGIKKQDLIILILLILLIITVILAVIMKGIRYKKKSELIVSSNKYLAYYPRFQTIEEYEALKVAYLHPALKGSDEEFNQDFNSGYLMAV